MDDHAPRGRAIDPHAHGAEGIECPERIRPLEKTVDLGHAIGERPQHDRAMGNRFIARHPGPALQGAARFDMENE